MDLKNLTAKEFIKGINFCIENAQTLFDFANHAKIIVNLGLSNSLFILSCEESIKAFAIYNAFLFDDNRDVAPIFKSHIEKLIILKEGYEFMSSETKAMYKSFKQAKKELPKAKNAEIEKRAKKLHKKYHKEIFDQIKEKEIKLNKEWWNKANLNKQRGFYVQFEEGKWISPSDFTESEVNETAQKALLVLGHILGYKDINERIYKSKKLKN